MVAGESITIPYDVHDTWQEFVIIMPLGWVRKDSIHVALGEQELTIKGERSQPSLKEGSVALNAYCFWGVFQQVVPLPGSINIDQIRSELTPENILLIILPKLIKPEAIVVHIR